MTVSINGDTGVSAVQSGAVDVADIPNGEITSDKLSSTIDLSSKTVSLPNEITFPDGTFRSIFIPVTSALNPAGGNSISATFGSEGIMGDSIGGSYVPIGYYQGIEINSTNPIYWSWIMPSDYKTNGNIRLTYYTIGQFIGSQTVTLNLYHGSVPYDTQPYNAGLFQGGDLNGELAPNLTTTFTTTNNNPDHQAWQNGTTIDLSSGIAGKNLYPRDLVMMSTSSAGFDTGTSEYDVLPSGILIDYETRF